MANTILLIRHGETDGNTQEMIQPPTIELNSAGISQVTAMAKKLQQHGNIEHLISSSMNRAIMSAEIIQNYLNLPKVQKSKLFDERSCGCLTGMTIDQIALLHPEHWDSDGNRVCLNNPPDGAEGMTELMNRAQEAYNHLMLLETSTIVVSHGTIMRAILAIHHGCGFNDTYDIHEPIPNAGIVKLK